ncbi:prepilin peptidase [Candidatus Woesearchaeota archaeon]|nr:prepilin peptidase [Candidatus Woesearchaeota archaeon]
MVGNILFSVLSYVLCFLGLLVGSLTDLKTREVPDLVNFGLLITGFCLSLLTSLVFWNSSYFISSVLGFALCFLLACIMFYTGQWGGGDAKMLMAMGSLIGLPLSSVLSFSSLISSDSFFSSITLSSFISFPFLVLFLLLVFFVGGIYGTAWLFVLLLKHYREFMLRCVVYLTDRKQRFWIVLFHSLSLLLFVFSFFVADLFLRLLSLLLAFMILVLFYGFIAIKVLEQIAFVKEIPVSSLTEGDWVSEDIIVAGKVIVRKKDLGVSREQLQELHALAKKGKITHVLVKYGIPFVPSFLLAFLVCVVLVYLL